jgi:anti-anti-sigma factor
MTADPTPRPPAEPASPAKSSLAQPGPGGPLAPLSEPAPSAAGDALILEQAFDADSLYALRAAVAAHGLAAGLSPGRADDLVIAVHELAANAVRHGAGHGELRVWRAGHTLRCQISDDGLPAAAEDGQAPSGDGAASGEKAASAEKAARGEKDVDGNPAARWRTEPGHGLSLVRQIADQSSLTSGPDGTLATVSFALGAAQGPFGLERQQLDGATVLAVAGPLDLSSAGQLTQTIDVLLTGTPDLPLVLDLSRLAEWDSAGLAALLTAQQRVSASPPARMVLAGLPDQLSRHLHDAGLADRFTLAGNAKAAADLLA